MPVTGSQQARTRMSACPSSTCCIQLLPKGQLPFAHVGALSEPLAWISTLRVPSKIRLIQKISEQERRTKVSLGRQEGAYIIHRQQKCSNSSYLFRPAEHRQPPGGKQAKPSQCIRRKSCTLLGPSQGRTHGHSTEGLQPGPRRRYIHTLLLLL